VIQNKNECKNDGQTIRWDAGNSKSLGFRRKMKKVFIVDYFSSQIIHLKKVGRRANLEVTECIIGM